MRSQLQRLPLLGILLLGQLAQAQPRQFPWEPKPQPNVIEDRIRFDVGLWRADIDTVIRSDATAQQPGSVLDGESDVGLSDGASIADVELTLLPGKRHVARLHGFTNRRSGKAVLSRSVQYDGNTYLVGQTVLSTLNLDMLGGGYAYRLFRHPRFELDVGVDIEVTHVETNVYVPFSGTREADAGTLPIPMLDGELRWEFWRRFELQGRYRWLGGSGNDGKVTGTIRDMKWGLGWQFNQHLNVGVFQRTFSINVTSQSGSHPGALKLEYTGWELMLRASM